MLGNLFVDFDENDIGIQLEAQSSFFSCLSSSSSFLSSSSSSSSSSRWFINPDEPSRDLWKDIDDQMTFFFRLVTLHNPIPQMCFPGWVSGLGGVGCFSNQTLIQVATTEEKITKIPEPILVLVDSFLLHLYRLQAYLIQHWEHCF